MTASDPYAARAHAASGVLADGQALVTAISNGSWVEGGLSAFAFAPDDGPDPLDALRSAGLGWLAEHLAPLPGWVDDLATDAAQVRAFSQDWADVARSLSSAAGQMSQAVAADLTDAAGDAADAYRSLTADVVAHVEGTAAWAEGLSSGLQTAATVQDAVRGTVRDALGRAVGSVLARYGQEVGDRSGAVPALVAHTATVAAQAAEEVGPCVRGLLGSLRTLGGLMDDLGGVLRTAQSLFDDIPELGRRAFHDGLGQTHAPLPDVTDVPHPCDGGDVGTWASTVAARHGTLTADEVTAVYRYTQVRREANELVRSTEPIAGVERSDHTQGAEVAEPVEGAGRTSDVPGSAAPGARTSVAETLSELDRLPLADLRTVHVAALPEAVTDTVRLGQQLPAVLLTPADDGNAQVHVDWRRRTDSSSLSHYRDEGTYTGAYLEVVGRQWNPAEGRWEIFARQR